MKKSALRLFLRLSIKRNLELPFVVVVVIAFRRFNLGYGLQHIVKKEGRRA